MRRFHLALSTHDLPASIEEYNRRLGQQPVSIVAGEYALWRTESLNISVRQDVSVPAGQLRHVGWEDDSVSEFSSESDCNGILWERFSFANQCEEIVSLWPEATIKA